MRVAALYDIHGNLPALRAVLADVARSEADAIVVGGPEVEFRSAEYDLDDAVAELRAGGFPDLDEMIRDSLLEPLDPGAVAEFFERQASRPR